MTELPSVDGPTRSLHPAPLEPGSNPLVEWFLSTSDGLIHKWHHYFAIYHETLAGLRDRPIRLLEIGVDRGGSLRMWHDYFAEGSVIVGIDIDVSCLDAADPDRDIHVRIADQSDPSQLLTIADEFGPFDIVIDDGGHTAGQQIGSFKALYLDHLTAYGRYVVEDTHTSYWPEFHDLGPDVDFMRFATTIAHELNAAHFEHRRADFAVERELRLHQLEVPAFTAVTRAVHFYDSMVVFDRSPKPLPAVERR